MVSPPSVYDEKGVSVALGPEIGRGGEGIILSLVRNALECAKIYSKSLPPEEIRKLEVMVASPPDDPTWATQKHRSIAWPAALLYRDPRPVACVGFKMPRVNNRRFQKALHYIDPADRTKLLGGGFNWKYLFTTAYNISSAVAAVHAQGHLIGDLNESNILVAPNALITLIDCDSFQIRDTDTDRVFRCPMGKPEYTAPEIQGKSFRDVDRTAETDNFALAILLFQLLMEGTHPYQAKGKLVEDAASTQAKIVKGLYPYGVASGKDLAPPDHALPYEILPHEIQELFLRCFRDGHGNPLVRPSAHDWFEAFRKFGNRFRQCAGNTNHLFLDHLSVCPWCRIAVKKGKDPFPSPVGQQIELAAPANTTDSLGKRLKFLNTYVVMALADGILTAEQESYLNELGSKLKIPPKEIKKAIEAEAKRVKGRLGNSAGGAPKLEISKSQFEFQNLRPGSMAQGAFIISNTGGGILQGSIKSDRLWLKLLQDQIDTTRHRQEISFRIDATGLSLGLRERGLIEIRCNGGTEVVAVDLSIEVPDVALGRFRKGVFWLGFSGGGLWGYLLYQLVPGGPSRDVIAALAGFLGIIAAIVAGSRVKGFAGGCGGLMLGLTILGVLEKISPEAFSTLSWAITYGAFLHVTSRPFFVAKQIGKNSVILTVAFGAVLVSAAVILGGLFLAERVDLLKLKAQLQPLPPLQTGLVATCSSATGWKSYKPKTSFQRGDQVWVYAEALNVCFDGRADVSFTLRITGPAGGTLPVRNGRYAAQTQQPHCAFWDKIQLPADAAPGAYVAQVEMLNNLTGQIGSASVNFTVLPAKKQVRANQASAPDVSDPWHGTQDAGRVQIALGRQHCQFFRGRIC